MYRVGEDGSERGAGRRRVGTQTDQNMASMWGLGGISTRRRVRRENIVKGGRGKRVRNKWRFVDQSGAWHRESHKLDSFQPGNAMRGWARGGRGCRAGVNREHRPGARDHPLPNKKCGIWDGGTYRRRGSERGDGTIMRRPIKVWRLETNFTRRDIVAQKGVDYRAGEVEEIGRNRAKSRRPIKVWRL